jgi:hypothetical protein
MLANGDEGATVEVRPGALATWGRREGYEGRGGITDYGTLTAATQVSLGRQTGASETLTLVLDPAMPAETPALPRPGGYLRYDQRRLDPHASWNRCGCSRSPGTTGPDPAVSLELNDLWVDGDVKRGRQLDAILNGSSANQRVPTVPITNDKLAPGPTPGLAVTSTAYIDGKGQTFAQATATWMQCTTNSDGSVISDLLRYDLEWKQPTVAAGSQIIATPNVVTLWQWSNIVAGAELWVRVRAVDRWVNGGEWSEWVTLTAGDDVTPPPQPSLPTVDNYLGLLRVAWDGTFVAGAGRPSDFRRVEVHVGTQAGFAIDTRSIEAGGTLAGNLIAAGYVFLEVPYKQSRYAKLVAVDNTGNRSVISDEASGMSGQLVSADLFDGVLDDSRLIANVGLFRTANILELNLNDGKVSNLDVGKLQAGVMTAQVIMGGTISTNADPTTTGGVQINGLGIFAWAPPVGGAAPVQTVAIDTQGNATLTGIYRTAPVGRRIEIGTGATTGVIAFYGPTGAQTYLQSVGSGSSEYVELGRVVSGRVDVHRLQLHSNGTTYNRALSHQTTFVDTYTINVATSTGDAGQTVYRIDNGVGEHTWYPAAEAGRLVMRQGNVYDSPAFKFINQSGYGMTLKAYYAGSGSVTLNVKDVNDSGYGTMMGLSFVSTSDRSGKMEIQDVGDSLLDAVRGTKVRQYRRRPARKLAKNDPNRHGLIPEWTPPVEIGLIAQEAPAQIVRDDTGDDGQLGVDLYQMSAMTWGATAELAGLHEKLAAQVEDLTAKLAALTRGPAK